MNKKKIIFFDIDYTLFDTTAYKKSVVNKISEVVGVDREKIAESVEETYKDVRSFGSFDPHLFASFFKKKHQGRFSEKIIENIWWQEDILKSAIYPEVVMFLQHLQKVENLTLGIFSSGKTEFQLVKISKLEDFFHKDHIHIASFKEETLSELMKAYEDESVTLVDDYIEILQKAKKMKPDIQTIWIKRGRFAENTQTPYDFEPDGIIRRLNELSDFLS